MVAFLISDAVRSANDVNDGPALRLLLEVQTLDNLQNFLTRLILLLAGATRVWAHEPVFVVVILRAILAFAREKTASLHTCSELLVYLARKGALLGVLSLIPGLCLLIGFSTL